MQLNGHAVCCLQVLYFHFASEVGPPLTASALKPSNHAIQFKYLALALSVRISTALELRGPRPAPGLPGAGQLFTP